MKALVYTAPKTMEYRDEPMPVPGAGESLIRIEAAGVCGSDMHAWHGHDARRVPPIILGHEVAGAVIEGAWAGQNVTMNPLIVCGRCDYCRAGRDNLCVNRTMIGMTRPGGFAEYITIPDHCLVPIPDGVDPARAAVTEPAAVCLHAVNVAKGLPNLRDLAEQRILIIGAGSVGILTGLLLRAAGVADLTLAETNPHRRRTAADATGARVINSLQQAPEARGFHGVFDCVGSAATRAASLNGVKDGGYVIHIGLQEAGGELDARRLTLGEIVFAGVYTYAMAEFREALEQLSGDALGDFAWMRQDALQNGGECFHAIDQGRSPAAKIVLRPAHG